MFFPNLSKDYKEAAALERKRVQEEERKARIFNPKVRQIGIDVKMLNQQVIEKKTQMENEKKTDLAYAHDAIKHDQIAHFLDQKMEEDKKKMNIALNEFRIRNQAPENRREFDLYDPNGLKKDLPARISDEDPRCTLSTLQKFEGEDLDLEIRKKDQESQYRAWIEHQVKEKRLSDENKILSEKLIYLKMKEMDERMKSLMKAEEECRKAMSLAEKEFNEALMKEQRIKREVRKRQEEEDNKYEIINNFYGDFLTENPDAADSALGCNRKISHRWKGMSSKELQEIYKFQEKQRLEAQKAREEIKKENEIYAAYLEDKAKELAKQEKELERRKKEMLLDTADQNKRMALYHKKAREYLDRTVYTNAPSEEFFDQFNRGTR